jgi:hypothetical protein
MKDMTLEERIEYDQETGAAVDERFAKRIRHKGEDHDRPAVACLL